MQLVLAQHCAELRFNATASNALKDSTPAVVIGGFPNGTYDVTYNIMSMNAFNVNHVYIVPLHVSQVDASPKLASCIAVVTVPKSN